MTCEEQLAEWVKGNSIHNDDRDGLHECCPDFSCCQPELKASPEIRREFAEADESKRVQMLFQFLGKAMAHMGARDDVYIAGLDREENPA